MKSLILPSPAKINLFLHILGRFPNGYHRLQTAFQFLDFHDEIAFSLRKDNKVIIECPGLDVPLESNTLYRAAHLLKDAATCTGGVTIQLTKRIPVGGGLGGGSSNAATTLLALNKLWDLKLSLEELMHLGVMLGADVPVFIGGRAAWAEGIGEELQAIDLPQRCCLVIIPACKIATAEIYTAAELTRDTPAMTIAEFLKRGGHNDCEPVVRKRYPEVDQALRWLNQYKPAKMTGTGACIFALFDTETEAKAVQREIPSCYQSFLTTTLSISPLHLALKI